MRAKESLINTTGLRMMRGLLVDQASCNNSATPGIIYFSNGNPSTLSKLQKQTSFISDIKEKKVPYVYCAIQVPYIKICIINSANREADIGRCYLCTDLSYLLQTTFWNWELMHNSIILCCLHVAELREAWTELSPVLTRTTKLPFSLAVFYLNVTLYCTRTRSHANRLSS